MRIIGIDPRIDSVWRTLVAQQPSSVFHSPGWLQVLADTYDLDVGAYILLDDAGEPQAGIPFCRVADMMGERLITLPFSDYCDPLVANSDQWASLSNKMIADKQSIIVRCLHNTVPCGDERFSVFKQAKWHGIRLERDLAALWSGLPSVCRTAITKARRNGVIVRAAQGADELRAFFDLHLKLRKYKYHLLAQPYRFFEQIWHQFIEQHKGVLLVAVYQDMIIGGVLFLEWKNTLYYKFNASAPANLAYRPNDLLIWEGMQYAKAKGCNSLDFGLSDWDQEGLVRYKRKFASEEKAISFLRYEAEEAPAHQSRQIRGLLSTLTELFTSETVPDSITDKAGEILYRYFA